MHKKYKSFHISAGDKLVYADNEQEKLCICELHDGTEVECKRGTKFRPFKPKSLVLDEYSNIKVRQPLYLTVVKKAKQINVCIDLCTKFHSMSKILKTWSGLSSMCIRNMYAPKMFVENE